MEGPEENIWSRLIQTKNHEILDLHPAVVQLELHCLAPRPCAINHIQVSGSHGSAMGLTRSVLANTINFSCLLFQNSILVMLFKDFVIQILEVSR